MAKKYLSIGLMSGTSLDGIDAALLETDGENHIVFKHALYQAYKPEFRERMQRLAKEDLPIMEMLRLEKELTEEHALAVKALLEKGYLTPSDIDVVGFHGQTIRHAPDEGITLQIGNASLLSELVGIPVVSDFRRRDMAVKGEGAPLAPLYHQALFHDEELPAAILNIGGVANLTWMGANGEIIAGDTGPGMGLIDAVVKDRTKGAELFDEDGQHTMGGVLDEQTLMRALDLPYFDKPFPKSADRYDFDNIDLSYLPLENACRTLCEITVGTVLKSLKELPTLPKRLWLTGGGVKHPVIMKVMQEKCAVLGVEVFNVEDKGLNSSFIEAECFAWLAVRRLENKHLSVPSTTGCQKSVCGGILTA
ncbi:MAG: anhydro-N-acetylmuramic acid kinase [Alphaproteobacteria bacterium]|jgi:anhydro-N-acetylmuramic acid kinase